jgi:hypothetical protein
MNMEVTADAESAVNRLRRSWHWMGVPLLLLEFSSTLLSAVGVN